MPAFRQIESRLTPSGTVSAGPSARPIDLSPVAQGLQQAMRDVEFKRKQAEAQRKQDEALVARQQEDEARIAVGNAVSERRQALTEQLVTASASPDGLAGATARVLQEHEAWVKATDQGLTEPGKKLLALAADDVRLLTHERFFTAETSARQVSLTRDFASGLDADIRTVSADPSQFTDLLARRIATASTLNLPERDRAAMVEASREQLALYAALTVTDRDPDAMLARAGAAGAKTGKDGKPLPSDPAKAAAAVARDPLLSNLSPDKLRQIVDRATTIKVQREALAEADLERRRRAAEIAANKREREANQAYTIVSSFLRDGRTMDMTSPSNMEAVRKMAGTPYEGAYRTLLAEAPLRAAAAMQPLPVQRAELDSLIARRNTGGSSAELEKEIKRREDVLTSAEREYTAEPLRAAAERGIFTEVAALDTSSVDSMAQGLQARVQQADIVASQTGRAVSPLTSDEADKLSSLLAPLPADQKAQQLAKLSVGMTPKQAQALAGQVAPKDKPLSLALAVGASRTTQGRLTSELILRGAQALTDKTVKEESGAEYGMRAQLAEEVGEAVSGNSRQDVIEAARLILLGKQAAGESASPRSAVAMAIGGPIVEHNGRRIPVPAGVDDVAGRLEAYPVSAIAQQAPDGFVYLPGGRPMGVPEFLVALPSAQLEPIGLGRYGVRSGGSLVVNQNGAPVVVNLK